EPPGDGASSWFIATATVALMPPGRLQNRQDRDESGRSVKRTRNSQPWGEAPPSAYATTLNNNRPLSGSYANPVFSANAAASRWKTAESAPAAAKRKLIMPLLPAISAMVDATLRSASSPSSALGLGTSKRSSRYTLATSRSFSHSS